MKEGIKRNLYWFSISFINLCILNFTPVLLIYIKKYGHFKMTYNSEVLLWLNDLAIEHIALIAVIITVIYCIIFNNTIEGTSRYKRLKYCWYGFLMLDLFVFNTCTVLELYSYSSESTILYELPHWFTISRLWTVSERYSILVQLMQLYSFCPSEEVQECIIHNSTTGEEVKQLFLKAYENSVHDQNELSILQKYFKYFNQFLKNLADLFIDRKTLLFLSSICLGILGLYLVKDVDTSSFFQSLQVQMVKDTAAALQYDIEIFDQEYIKFFDQALKTAQPYSKLLVNILEIIQAEELFINQCLNEMRHLLPEQTLARAVEQSIILHNTLASGQLAVNMLEQAIQNIETLRQVSGNNALPFTQVEAILNNLNCAVESAYYNIELSLNVLEGTLEQLPGVSHPVLNEEISLFTDQFHKVQKLPDISNYINR